MAAHTLQGLCRPRPGLALLCSRFSQRNAAGTEYRSSHSLDKLYPPRQDGTTSRTSEEPQPPALDIPVARLTVSYSRSSGPGGQNVNKVLETSGDTFDASRNKANFEIYRLTGIIAATVNSKAEIRFHLASADWIPEAVRQKMALMHRNKINRAGELIVTSEESRYQMRNLAICLEKIRTMVTEAIEKPKVVSKETTQQLIERVEKMNRERLRQKKIHSAIKQSRKADFD